MTGGYQEWIFVLQNLHTNIELVIMKNKQYVIVLMLR